MKLAYSACRPRVSNTAACLDKRIQEAIQRRVLMTRDGNEDREKKKPGEAGASEGPAEFRGSSQYPCLFKRSALSFSWLPLPEVPSVRM